PSLLFPRRSCFVIPTPNAAAESSSHHGWLTPLVLFARALLPQIPPPRCGFGMTRRVRWVETRKKPIGRGLGRATSGQGRARRPPRLILRARFDPRTQTARIFPGPRAQTSTILRLACLFQPLRERLYLILQPVRQMGSKLREM